MIEADVALLRARVLTDTGERTSLDDVIRDCALDRAELERELNAEIAAGLHPLEGDPA